MNSFINVLGAVSFGINAFYSLLRFNVVRDKGTAFALLGNSLLAISFAFWGNNPKPNEFIILSFFIGSLSLLTSLIVDKKVALSKVVWMLLIFIASLACGIAVIEYFLK